MIKLIRFTKNLAIKNKIIFYEKFKSNFGQIYIAVLDDKICYCSFDKQIDFSFFEKKFNIHSFQKMNESQKRKSANLLKDFQNKASINVDLIVRATDFQFKVWNELLCIFKGSTSSYKQLSCNLNLNKAYQAVGSAVASNPVALFIPCHRVIKESGALGGYKWGAQRKKIILEAENCLW